MRVIFDLPPQFGSFPHPLAYIEWFTPLRNKRPDPKVGLYQISPSTHQHRPNAAVVSVDKIRRACHLIPKSGVEIDRTLTKDNALDIAKQFWVNSYIAIDLRVLME